MKVWKYSLKQVGLQHIQMPVGAKLLSVQAQNGGLSLWVLVDPHQVDDAETRRICIIGTGHHYEGAFGSDRQCIPLCSIHHNETHRRGVKSFAAKYGIDYEKAVRETNERVA